MKLTEGQANALEHAATLPPDLEGAFPRRGQHQMYARLLLLGLLEDGGRGVDVDDHMHEVDLYRITPAGRTALAKYRGRR